MSPKTLTLIRRKTGAQIKISTAHNQCHDHSPCISAVWYSEWVPSDAHYSERSAQGEIDVLINSPGRDSHGTECDDSQHLRRAYLGTNLPYHDDCDISALLKGIHPQTRSKGCLLNEYNLLSEALKKRTGSAKYGRRCCHVRLTKHCRASLGKDWR